MKIQSTEFRDGGRLPERFAAQGANVSPPLEWQDAPPQTKSFAVVCEDPDAPHGTFMHWGIYNIPADVHSLPENGSTTLANSDNIVQATNSSGSVGYFGPKPPGGETHHYRFRLFALDDDAQIEAGIPVSDLLQTIKPHVIQEADITGLYKSE